MPEHSIFEGCYRKFDREDGATVYVRLDVINASDWVFVDHHDPKSQGYGGSTIGCTLEDGTVDYIKGPWHGGPAAVPLNIVELYLSKVEVREYNKDGALLYKEDHEVLGSFYRGTRIAQQLAMLRGIPVWVKCESNGGASSGTKDPNNTEVFHPLSRRKGESVDEQNTYRRR